MSQALPAPSVAPLQAERPAPFGAQLLAPDRTRFRLWAPACTRVLLEIDGAEPMPMARRPGGCFEIEAPCGAGTQYRYRIGPDLAIADPASRRQAGDVFDASVVVDPAAYAWTMDGWHGRPWHEMVIYELHVGAIGGFAAVQGLLPHLVDLGVSALELMPVGDFGGRRNWGYDGVLPYAPAAAYGTPEQLKALVDAAHAAGLCIYLDVVYNHFGPAGNYLHACAPPFFDGRRSSPWGAAIDFAHPMVREFFIANALQWVMEYRFDGLRLDAVHAIGDAGFLGELCSRVRGAVAPGRQVHLILENEANQAQLLESGFDAQWNDDGHNALHVLLTGEREGYYSNYADAPAAQLARCLAEGFAYQGEPMPSHGGRPRGTPSAHLPPQSFVLFLQNHDQVGNRALGERLSVLADPQTLGAAAVLLLLCPQVPLLFMGEECGLTTPFLFFTDFHDALADAVREGRRREFAAFAAFADAAERQRIPDPNDEQTFLRSVPALDALLRPGGDGAGRQWLDFYRKLLELRRRFVIPGLPGARSIAASVLGEAAVAAAWRLGDGTLLRIAVNLGADDVATAAIAGTVIYATANGCTDSATCLPARSAVAWLEAAQ
jgi:maltooligosyltrehalose trehalohydrolase